MKQLLIKPEQQLILLLLGVINKPIPSKLHIHKELFVLSRVYPRLNELLEYEAYRKGPFSRVIQDALEELIERGFVISKHGEYQLTREGLKAYREIFNSIKRRDLIETLKNIRDIYDKLDRDELLLIIYLTYPEYTIESEEVLYILTKAPKIIKRLYEKGVITSKRSKELYEKARKLMSYLNL